MWPTDRFRRKSGDAAPRPETPLVLIGRDGRRRVVLAADAAAQTAGLRIGMPASKAQALVPGLIVHDAEPDADEIALERLALWVLRRYAPIVSADPPDGLVIDTTGADHLHGGEAAMLTEMVDRLAASGFAARAAVADTWVQPTRWRASARGRRLWFHPAPLHKRSCHCRSLPFACPP
jgi:protein ImuB